MRMNVWTFFDYLDAFDYSLNSESKDGQKQNKTNDLIEYSKGMKISPDEIMRDKMQIKEAHKKAGKTLKRVSL